MQYTVTAFVNVHPDSFFGLGMRHPIAEVDTFTVKADTLNDAAEAMFTIGNRMGCDLHGKQWPSDVRSLSVGDVIKIDTPRCHDHPDGRTTYHCCDRFGWGGIPAPLGNPLIPLEGSIATSR